ncbi:Hypothetical protein TART1_1856 [Trichococcus shcherbakoviae]|uniref:Uncharacterized protein n=1 Tax=Trichococcus shcherbakoviae TaxID=2094020 RepID=A0A383TF86_9LACT|nr:Hypothetical protein TART1_1856 [Trichococcus shcherbakoviae]
MQQCFFSKNGCHTADFRDLQKNAILYFSVTPTFLGRLTLTNRKSIRKAREGLFFFVKFIGYILRDFA